MRFLCLAWGASFPFGVALGGLFGLEVIIVWRETSEQKKKELEVGNWS